MTVVLGIETSCDDTCAAVVEDGWIRSSVVASQGVHDAFGGVVPEVAARAHVEVCDLVIADALARADARLDDVDLVAVTQGPGLTGALLVGVAAAKSVAAARDLPLCAVDHLHGHVAASFLEPEPVDPPFLGLLVSGGHSLLVDVDDHDGFEVLGATLDDAAGEALDKGARMLGLGYPGGPALERLAGDGDPEAFAFPTAEGVAGLDLSFAGVKTSLLYAIRDLGGEEAARPRAADLAASYQHAVVEQLARRTARALDATGHDLLVVCGGVAANGVLRRRLAELDADVFVPEPALCTDNAAMIAAAALHLEPLAPAEALALDVYATGSVAP